MAITKSGVEGIIDQEVKLIIADVEANGFATREYHRRKYQGTPQTHNPIFYVYRSTLVAKLRDAGYYVCLLYTSDAADE